MKQNQIGVINDSVYNVISSVLYMVIYNADENNDFLVPYNLLKPLSAIYHEVSGLPEFLIVNNINNNINNSKKQTFSFSYYSSRSDLLGCGTRWSSGFTASRAAS